MIRLFAALLALGLAAAPAQAADATLHVTEAWARATPGAAPNGGAFLTIVNTGAADTLVSAAAPVAERVELHTHVMDGAIMRMRPIDAIDIPAGQTVRLAPGGLHVMFINLKQPLRAGTSVPLTLTFAQAGSLTVDIPVAGPGAMAPAGAEDHAAHGHH